MNGKLNCKQVGCTFRDASRSDQEVAVAAVVVVAAAAYRVQKRGVSPYLRRAVLAQVDTLHLLPVR
jgi:hypothetical protein